VNIRCNKLTSFLGLLSSILFSVSATSAQDTFEEFLRQQQQGIDEEEQAFTQYQAQVTAEYREFYVQQEREFDEYVNQIIRKWGEGNAVTTTKKEWVSYSGDYRARSRVDLEQGQARIEVLADESDAKDQQAILSKLHNEVVKAVTDKGASDPLDVKERIPPKEKPVLAGQVQTRDGKLVTESNAKKFADDILQGTALQQQELIGKDGKRRISFAITFPLIPDHVKVRASEFRDLVQRYAKRFDIDPTLVFAVIHTESWFNPKARSRAPAYGLMQLVPKSGARAAYMHIHQKDQLVTPEYLYQPQNNIQLGAGYLDLLLKKDFKDVKDEKSRLYCAVAAYNTGPGNVARAFINNRNVPKAIAVINRMTSAEAFDHLRSKLPFQETREYIEKVTHRMPLYSEWGALK